VEALQSHRAICGPKKVQPEILAGSRSFACWTYHVANLADAAFLGPAVIQAGSTTWLGNLLLALTQE